MHATTGVLNTYPMTWYSPSEAVTHQDSYGRRSGVLVHRAAQLREHESLFCSPLKNWNQVPQVPLICETKPMISIQQMMTYQNQKNGCFQPPPPGSRQDHYHQEVARLMQLEEGFRPLEKKKHAHPSHHKREHRDKDHCSVDMNGLETNV
ncbi:hypothetical protein NQZ68_040596 [Dissostichus eleginoides]|nr:hypothetical protein NQZ68_040596 [Dissostichus eleginoides]